MSPSSGRGSRGSLTAGGIHTALHYGRRAGLAIAAHLLDGGPDPARALASIYPNFTWKRLLRRMMDLGPPDRLVEAAFAGSPFRALAQTVFFHHRGSFSSEAWWNLVRDCGWAGP